MPRISKKPVDKNLNKELKDNFSYLISSLSTPLEIEQFFNDFLTSEENTMLSKRLMLHLMLENKYETSQIKAVLGISKETIRVHGYIWKNGGEKYKKTIQKIAKREKTKEFWKKIEKLLKPLELALESKTNMKARAKFATGDWE